MGYRHIDTAFIYGNERAIGKALQEYFEATNLRREEVFITTKLLPNFMTESAVGPALDESLRRLRLDYVDLFLIHIPCAMKHLDSYPEKHPGHEETVQVDLRETWKAMEETVYKGKARSIGVSSFNAKQLDYILEVARIKPAVNQVEAHARFPQKKLHAFCKSRNIQLEAFSPLGSPYFNGSAILNTIQSADNVVENSVVMDMAQKYKRTTGQILLRNLVQRGIVVIPKSENPQRMRENIEIFSFSLSDEDMKRIDELDNGERRFCFSCYGHLRTTSPVCKMHVCSVCVAATIIQWGQLVQFLRPTCRNLVQRPPRISIQ
ncbi:alcohol dehydrogenase [NADP(+)] A-like isoform X2 [Mizuhopecten yessoensis]|nr:alcohol dehydrogenase [NADP(+)] A-like isoform X2 [Mizuhopecten yessoensis]XP_021362149.1 alcohol dehydrogenase [NADP(+)] A-like isoform X2 [Mizuhopecten yessoensis]XP_021362150.1 alcohol dehydrogenase [NADP(+)] A-like isoform X2 [Mizuhopecten yessoensis]